MPSRPMAHSWRIDTTDKDMPWYVLSIHAGLKRFEHYR